MAQIMTVQARAFFRTLEWMLELHRDQPEIASMITQIDNIFVVVPWRHAFCHVNLFVRLRRIRCVDVMLTRWIFSKFERLQ